MAMWRVLLGVLAVGTMVAGPVAVAAEGRFAVERTDEGAVVRLDGQLLAGYLVDSGGKPILWPLVGPSGVEVTRAYPMREPGEHERTDHVHQRSLWFTHGDVNGVSYWHEGSGSGTIVHREFVELRGGEDAVLATRNEWVDPQGQVAARDVRRFTFAADQDGQVRWVDVDVTVTAGERAARFGDTKEGTFGVRVAGPMKVDARLGGRIVSSEGAVNADAWGQPAAWVDYHGPVGERTVGVAILNHPSSFRFPTYWHVRTYGLFAANPFGLRDFHEDPRYDGTHTLEPGESFSLFYRVVIHPGDQRQAEIAARFREYAEQQKRPLE